MTTGTKTQDYAGSKRNELMVSKPSFAATVQAKLPSLTSGAPMVEMKHGTHLGKPAVFFSAEDYFINLAQECKLTIIGNFYRGKPTMEEIRRAFVRQFHLSGPVKIAYFDPKHVYIDFNNIVDYNHIFFQRVYRHWRGTDEDIKMDSRFQAGRGDIYCPCMDSHSPIALAFV